jgi:carboxyl-terminal processing protease
VSKTAFLLLFAFVAPLLPGQVMIGAARGEPFAAASSLNQPMLVGVAAAALSFMAPRTLEAIAPAQLVIWGLRGLTTLDPRLTPDLQEKPGTPGVLRLIGPNRVLLARPAPAADDIGGWAAAIGQLSRVAWDNSDAVRRAGTEGIIRSFFDELFNHLDPYSRYTPPDEAATDRMRRSGRGGLGMTVATQSGNFIIAAVQGEGPAALAGIRVGERLVEIDGQSLQGASMIAVQALLSGPELSQVGLTLRARDGRSRNVVLERTSLPPETVEAKTTDDILFLNITGFARTTASRLAQELIRAMGADPQPLGVVIDLRGNRGGLLRQAAAAAAMLQSGGLVATTAGRDPQAAHEFRADGRDLAGGLPVVVVVDGRTASAAEILAAALSDQRRAVVVGSSTLGKGLVQTIAELPDGGELLVTWSRVLAPRGWPIQALGVLPQVCTSLGQDMLNRELQALTRGSQLMADALLRYRLARPPLAPAAALAIRATCPAAEGRELDMQAARFLIHSPQAYASALLPPSPALAPPPPPSTPARPR